MFINKTTISFFLLTAISVSHFSQASIGLPIPVDPEQNVKAFQCAIDINFSCSISREGEVDHTQRYQSIARTYDNHKPLQYTIVNALDVDSAYKICLNNQKLLAEQLRSTCRDAKINTSIKFERLVPWQYSCYSAHESITRHEEKFFTLAYSAEDALQFIQKENPERHESIPFFECSKSKNRTALIFEKDKKLKKAFDKFRISNPYTVLNVAIYRFFVEELSQPTTKALTIE
jgi:hypothetical protein